ncbi:uncharacterized protein [Euphorbia lathyris]|uniref:uncharacterized protein n=1 Tax=Euphorbia lathyris TaxID=212925 RepID=UPI003313EEC3
MQLLSGLNPEFDHVRDQILLMDSLPPVNRAYSMLIRIEKQRNPNSIAFIQNDFVNLTTGNRNFSNQNTGNVNRNNNGGNYGNRGNNANFLVKSKEEKFCSYCRKGGHEKNECFRINHQAHMSHEQQEFSPVDDFEEGEGSSAKKESVQELVQKEVQRILKGKTTQDYLPQEFSAFAGACAGLEF